MKRNKDYPNEWLQRDGILAWYDLRPDTSALCIHMPNGLLDIVRYNNIDVIIGDDFSPYSTDLFVKENKKFDYVFMYNTLDYCDDAKGVLNNIAMLLKNDGKFILMARNRLAVSRFCGDVFDVAKYSKSNYREMLTESGFSTRFFSVFPNLDSAQLIFSENYIPNESMQVRYQPEYNNTSKIFNRENALCDDLIENGAFHQFANAFFIECTKNQDFCDVQSATISFKRDEARASITRCFSDIVEKIAYFDEGKQTLITLLDNQNYLKSRGIDVVDYTLEGNILSSKYVDAVIATDYLVELAYMDKTAFLDALDKFYELICNSSDVVEDGELGPILRKGFIDLVPLNAFYKNGRYIVFDQEFVGDSIPANLMMYRTILILFEKLEIDKSLVTDRELFDRYGISRKIEAISKLERDFINGLGDYASDKMVTVQQISENWKNLFETNCQPFLSQLQDVCVADRTRHCFEDTEGKKIYVWGTGKWADKFMWFYKDELNIVGVIDNNPEKRGESFFGFNVTGPEMLTQDSDYKIIVCVKNCVDIISQILNLGIKDFGIYDANYIYPGRQNVITNSDCVESKKKYHVGYLSGVFDLYHIGHINMFRRAKEQCDYLIVAVTSDEYVRERKHREPFIPVDERVECVKSCKYVDEVFVTPFKYCGIVEAFQKYHYDVQFCGSDYADNPWWLEQKEWLEQHGSTIEFFPYTEQTSSTKIKALIEKGLL